MKPVSPAATYASFLPHLQEAARSVGYALAPHGSMARDFDLIAVPWTAEAESAERLIMCLIAASGGTLDQRHKRGDTIVQGDKPTEFPHGRLAWSIRIANDLYLDVSVMPRK